MTAAPWERQPGETPIPWAAFVAYRDMGPTRSYRKVAADLGKQPSQTAAWSKRYDWVARAEAWDIEQERVEREWLQTERRKAITRHVRQAQTLQSKWLTRLATLDPNSLSASEVLRYAEVATKMEREALGLAGPDVNVAVTVTDVTTLSPAEIRSQLEAVQAEIRQRLADAETVIVVEEQAP